MYSTSKIYSTVIFLFYFPLHQKFLNNGQILARLITMEFISSREHILSSTIRITQLYKKRELS